MSVEAGTAPHGSAEKRSSFYSTIFDFWLDRLDGLDRYKKIRDFSRPPKHSDPGHGGPSR